LQDAREVLTMACEQVGFGVIGTGVWGETHLKAYSWAPQIRLVAVCDKNEPLGRQRAEQYGAESFTTDYRELLAHPDLKAVSVVTPDFLHREIGVAAAEAGKHVLIEKPMAMTDAQSRAMVGHVERAGIKLCVDYNRRFAPSMVDLREAFHAYRADPKDNPHSFHWDAGRDKLPEEGKTMILVRVQDESSTYRMQHMDPGIGGGEMIGETCHWLDLVTWLMDADPVRIFATGSTRLGHIITLDFADGAHACIFFGASGTFDYPKELYEIQHQRALFINHCFVENEYYGVPGLAGKTYPLQFDDFPETGAQGGLAGYVAKLRERGEQYVASGKRTYGQVMTNKGHAELLDAFVTSILEDTPAPVDQRAGLRATHLSLRAIESVRAGQPLPVLTEDMHPHIHV